MINMNKRGIIDDYLKQIFILVLIIVLLYLFYVFVTGKVDGIVS
jgi:hypothetical protein